MNLTYYDLNDVSAPYDVLNMIALKLKALGRTSLYIHTISCLISASAFFLF